MFRKAKMSSEEGLKFLTRMQVLIHYRVVVLKFFMKKYGKQICDDKVDADGWLIFMKLRINWECIAMQQCYMAILKNMSIALIIWKDCDSYRIKQVVSIHLFHLNSGTRIMT